MQALLGLLTIAPMSGYDLGRLVRASISHMWRESYGQIYPNLKTLAAEGLVECRTERQAGRPERRVYSITEKGRAQLAEWLVAPPQPEIPRNEMLLKLFFGAQTPIDVLIGNVERMVEENSAILKKLQRTERDEIDKNPQYPDAPFWKMAARFGQMEMKAHLKWAEETLAELKRLATKQQNLSKSHKEKKHASI